MVFTVFLKVSNFLYPLLFCAVALKSFVCAQTPTVPQHPIVLLKDDDAWLRQLNLQGRIELQYATGSSNQGSYSSGDLPDAVRWGDADVRIFAAGVRAWLGDKFLFDTEANISPDFAPFYRDIDRMTLSWKASEAWTLSGGRMKQRFSWEYATAFRELLTFERTLIVNTLIPLSFATSVQSVYQRGPFKWTTSLAAGDYSPEFARFDEGVMFFSRFAWDAGPSVGLKSWVWQIDHFYNSRPDNSDARGYEHSFAISSGLEQGRWGLVAEGLYGTGYDKPDVWGAYLMPTFYLVPEKLQLVMRWQWADSESATGLRLLPRYESLAPGLADSEARGHDYQALYLGLNWYLLQHQFKLMTGAEYHRMDAASPEDEFEGWTFLTGMRAYF